MDLLYAGRFTGFCIVSSDSDFARLAARLREQGVTVYGFGERKTPRPFITACDKFVYFDVLGEQGDETAAGEFGHDHLHRHLSCRDLRNAYRSWRQRTYRLLSRLPRIGSQANEAVDRGVQPDGGTGS
ncbi:UNVERIFIED_ORG: hypothetical protein GGI57_005322 [Rhizobium aethiopicum]